MMTGRRASPPRTRTSPARRTGAAIVCALTLAGGATTTTARAADSTVPTGGGAVEDRPTAKADADRKAAETKRDEAPKAKPEAEPPPSAEDADACIDENVKADLFAKRKRRDVRDRLFQQTNRHEITALGGYYVSDLFDGTYIVGGAYAYHMTEDFAIEASGAYTRIASSGGPELERIFVLLGTKNRRELLFDADLVWDPAHGKLRLGGAIQHFDLYVAAGAGLIDSVLSSDIAGNAAIGLKFFLGRAMALRIDLRNYVFRQQLLARKEWVNDVTATFGISVFLPVSE